MVPKTAWLQTFFRISSFVFGRTKTFIQVRNDLRVSKWWQNFNLWVNYPFKWCHAVSVFHETRTEVFENKKQKLHKNVDLKQVNMTNTDLNNTVLFCFKVIQAKKLKIRGQNCLYEWEYIENIWIKFIFLIQLTSFVLLCRLQKFSDTKIKQEKIFLPKFPNVFYLSCLPKCPKVNLHLWLNYNPNYYQQQFWRN